MLEEILESFEGEDFLKADGFDDAVIGFDEVNMRLIYSVEKVLKILEKDMSALEAYEYYNFNMRSAYVGEKTPIWCWDLFVNK